MTNTATYFAEVSREEAVRQPRREQRVPSVFRIKVCGFNRLGRFFTERTQTSNVSDGGCELSLGIEVEKNSVLALRVIERRNGCELQSHPALFQVERIVPQPRGWTLGVSKLQSVPVWGIGLIAEKYLAPAS